MEIDNTYIDRFGSLAKDIIDISYSDEHKDFIGIEKLFEILDKYLPHGLPDINLKENNGWISTEHKLPKEPGKDIDTYLSEHHSFDMNDACFYGGFEKYNVMITGTIMSTSLYYIGNNEWYDTETMEEYSVTYWQPMPEPPV